MEDWCFKYAESAARTDQFGERPEHAELLAAGLLGEVGSVLAEIKKEVREEGVYPAQRRRLVEEVGDAMWYLTRLLAVLAPDSLPQFATELGRPATPSGSPVSAALVLAREVGQLCGKVEEGEVDVARQLLLEVAGLFGSVARGGGVDLAEAASENLAKIESRWPAVREHGPLFDTDYPAYEQLPRMLSVDFKRLKRGGTESVLLRSGGLNMGDRLTDNSKDPDFYRYHDVIHLSYAAYLGWSPVIRSLLRCKRKSRPEIDEVEDGARAAVAEEAVSFAVFQRAKEMDLFEGVDSVDFDLLKAVRELVVGLEVHVRPYWQWEEAILEGYRAFRQLTRNHGGVVEINVNERSLMYRCASASQGGVTGS